MKNLLDHNETENADVLNEKLIDASIPGYQAEFDPDEAERAGAFVEDALSEEDALETSIDLLDEEQTDLPVFVEDSQDQVPDNVTKANAWELLGIQPGESVRDSLERLEHQKE